MSSTDPTGPIPELADTAAALIVAKLRDPGAVFTGPEVAYLMSRSGRWGYEARVDEENGAYPEPRIFAFGKWYDQALEREKADAETARLLAQDRE